MSNDQFNQSISIGQAQGRCILVNVDNSYTGVVNCENVKNCLASVQGKLDYSSMKW